MDIDSIYRDAYESLALRFNLAHVGYHKGIRYDLEIKEYIGKWGEGYIVRHPSKPTSKFHMVEYWTV